jgi:ADP-ribose pyrophosphatase YjhB (NUDIX family)
MNFLQKVYYNDKTLVLTTDSETYINDNPEAEQFIPFSGATLRSFTQAIQQIGKPGIRGAIIEDASAAELVTQLQAMFPPVVAAGGLVENEHGEILMIFRRGKWDLPKGKLDEGENIEDCAIREVEEETGLESLTLSDKICDTFHIYLENKEQRLKHTSWYKMRGSSTQKLKPQKEEDILEAKWVNEENLPSLAAKSYGAIRDVLKEAGMRL